LQKLHCLAAAFANDTKASPKFKSFWGGGHGAIRVVCLSVRSLQFGLFFFGRSHIDVALFGRQLIMEASLCPSHLILAIWTCWFEFLQLASAVFAAKICLRFI